MHSRMTVMDLFDMIGGKFVYVTTFRFPPGAPQLKSLSCLLTFLVEEIDLNINQKFSIAYLDGDYEMRSINSDEEYEKIMDFAAMFEGPVQLVFVGMSVSDHFKIRKGGIPADEKLMSNLATFIRSNHVFDEEVPEPIIQSAVYEEKIVLKEQLVPADVSDQIGGEQPTSHVEQLALLPGIQSTEASTATHVQADMELTNTGSIQNIERMLANVPYEDYVAVPTEEPAHPTERLDVLPAKWDVEQLDVLTKKISEIDFSVGSDTLSSEQVVKSDGGQSTTVLDIGRAESAPRQNYVDSAESQNPVPSDLKKYLDATKVRDSLKMTEQTLLCRINYLLTMQDNLNAKVEGAMNEMQQVKNCSQKPSDYEQIFGSVSGSEPTDVSADIKGNSDDEQPVRRVRARGRGRKAHHRKGKGSRKGKK